MFTFKNKYSIPLVFFLTALTGCFSLAGDVTPPPGYDYTPSLEIKIPSPTQDINEVTSPHEIPNPNKGLELYLENCESCHGKSGLGDGSFAANLNETVPVLGSISIVSEATPNSWYKTITNGIADTSMQPFSHLSDQERWDIVAYLYTFSSNLDVISIGETLFNEHCAKCHGEDRSKGVVDLSNHSIMGGRSNQTLLAVIEKGKGSMPAFDFLSLSHQQAIVAYLRQAVSIPFEWQSETDVSYEDEITPGDSTIPPKTIREDDLSPKEGSTNLNKNEINVIVNNLSDAELPPSLEIILRGYNEMSETYSQTLNLGSESGVWFKDVPMTPGRLYFATMEYGNATFASDVITIDDTAIIPSLEIAYFQPTTNPDVLDVDRMHIFIDFIDQRTIEVFQLYVFSNPTNQVLVSSEPDGTVIDFMIPTDASNVFIEENMRLAYQKIDSGFGITSIYPDSDPYQAAFSYHIPYDTTELEISIPAAMDVNSLIVLAPSDGFKLKSNQLQEIGMREYEGTNYKMFTGAGLQSGNLLHLSLSGFPRLKSTSLGMDKTKSLVIGFGGFGVSLIITGFYLRRRKRSQEVEWFDEMDIGLESVSADDLLDAIISLDDQYRTGILPDEAYYQRRRFLKNKLRSTVNKE